MKITLTKSSTKAPKTDLLVGLIFQDAKKISSQSVSKKQSNFLLEYKVMDQINDDLRTQISESAIREEFKAKERESFVTSTLGLSNAHSLALVGLGEEKKQTVDLFRRCGGETYKIAKKKCAQKISIIVPEKVTVPLFDVVQAIGEGISLAAYKFDRYLTKKKKDHQVKEVHIQIPKAVTNKEKSALNRAQIISDGVCLARDMVNEGPMELNPVKFAQHAQNAATDCEINCKVLDEKQLQRENMGLMLSVANAAKSFAPPRLIKLQYKPAKKSKTKIALVGKGVTFDSGGLDIKPADGMLDMKMDMSGAAAVLGTMYAVGKIKPNVEVVGYLACVENGIGSDAYHPGDIIKSRKGTTVEIVNTDAEGRLVLADALDYTQEKDKPDIVIDIATLTGACMIALGKDTAGVFANHEPLSKEIISSGKNAGESLWPLPLNDALKSSLESNIADIKNCGDRWGGAITAALFLQEFIDSKTKWAHLDIAGTALTSKSQTYTPSGGVGYAVRTLVNFIMAQ